MLACTYVRYCDRNVIYYITSFRTESDFTLLYQLHEVHTGWIILIETEPVEEEVLY
jgi:hypothetical protein